MILPMTRVRILGPRASLDPTLAALQDAGVVHLAEPRPGGPLVRRDLTGGEVRELRHLRRFVRQLDALDTRLAGSLRPAGPEDGAAATPAELARWIRAAGRLHRSLDHADRRRDVLEAERAEITRFEQFVTAFRALLPRTAGRMRSYHLVLRGDDPDTIANLGGALREALGPGFVLETRRLPSGEVAALLLVPAGEAAPVERLLVRSGVQELPLPEGLEGDSLVEALPALERRRIAIDGELADLERRRAELVASQAPSLAVGRAVAQDRLLSLAARERAGVTPRTFVIEGWVPAAAWGRLVSLLGERAGPAVVVEPVGREEWRGESPPVVLRNPRFFRPFEAITRMLPLPAYGSIDPTPFVAVFFPMFFGLILGDIGYGLMLASLAGWLHRRSPSGSVGRAIAEILGPCAGFAIAFGLAFGEFFGDLGHRWFGLVPLVLNREAALLPFLGLAVAIGFVHIVLALVLGIVNAARGHPRQAVGRGAALVMVLVIAVALLAVLDILPRGLLTPSVVVLLVAFPVLVVAEGIIAPIELLSTLSNILSYARIMALGTASVMMAVVANRLAGTIGGIAVGLLFGLLFHLVNFVLGVFAPTVHGLRLHYVEFFGKFYSPGGVRYAPFAHWQPNGPDAPGSASTPSEVTT